MKSFADFGIGEISGSRALCPKCSPERRKSNEKCLSVDTAEGVWFCHHCGFKGTLKAHTDNEITIHFARPKFVQSDLPANVIEFFSTRGIDQKTLADNQISWAKGAIQFPYVKDGVTVNIKHRTLDKKFYQVKDAEKCLYRYDEIKKRQNDALIITEGEIDALSCYQAGFRSVTSIPDGAPTANVKEFKTKFDFLNDTEDIFASYKKIVICMDNDAPGRRAEEELIRRIGPENCSRVIYPEGCKDANDVLVKRGPTHLWRMISEAQPVPVYGLHSVNDFAKDLETLYDSGMRGGDDPCIPGLREYFTVRRGEFTVVTGIPSHGKSNLIDAMIIGMIKEHGTHVLFFSPENWPVQRHIAGLVEKWTEKPFSANYTWHDQSGPKTIPRITREELADARKDLDYHIQFLYPDEGSFPVDSILAKAKVAIKRHGVDIIVIDPWNELDHQMDRMTEAQYLSRELSKIRLFARQHSVHIFVVAHPRNLIKDSDGNYQEPTMYEISGGAHWRNKADNGLCVYRENMDNLITTLSIQKIRFREVGRPGEIRLIYNGVDGSYRAYT